MYVAVKGGERAIDYAHKLLADARRGDRIGIGRCMPDREHGAWRASQDGLGHASEDHVRQSAPPVRPDDQQIDLFAHRVVDDRLDGRFEAGDGRRDVQDGLVGARERLEVMACARLRLLLQIGRERDEQELDIEG